MTDQIEQLNTLRARLGPLGYTIEPGTLVTNGYRANWVLRKAGDQDAWFKTLNAIEGWANQMEQTEQKRKRGRPRKTPPPAPGYVLNDLVTGDARTLEPSLPDQSVDLVFADPVYQNVDDYAWLAQVAQRVLTERGVVLVWSGFPKLGRIQCAMEDAGLEYVYTLTYTVVAKTFRMRWYNLFCWSTPCLWFQRKGRATRPRRWVPDTYQTTVELSPDQAEQVDVRAVCSDTFISTAGPSGTYAWNKNVGVLTNWMDVFSPIGGTVWDPFTGEASIPIVAQALRRPWYASELLPDVAERGRERLRAQTVPIPFAPVDPFQSVPLDLGDAA